MTERQRHTWFAAVLYAGSALVAANARGDSVAQVQTSKRITAETVALIDPESGTSTGGGSSEVRLAVGDVITFRFQFTPVPNGAVRGLGGYITDYIPPNTQVVGARIVDRFGNTVTPRPGGLTADGWGQRGPGNFPPPLQEGSMSQLYADTGIFFSTDPRTARNPSDQLITVFNGIPMNPPPTGGNQLDERLGIPNGGTLYAHNQWDWVQTMAFGTKGELGPPVGGDIRVDGKGNTPHRYGSAIAGPDTWYGLEATQTGADLIEAAGNTGPWQRIYYPGSTTGVGSAATGAGTATRVGVPTAAGWDLSVDNPLPVGTNAVRYAVGELVVGEEYFAEISLKVLGLPLDPGLGTSGANANCAEVFGGDGSATSETKGGKDNPWRYFVPSPACVRLDLLFEVDVDKILAVVGDQLTYTIRVKNLSLSNHTNVVITDTYETGEVSFVSATGAPAVDTGTGTITWTIPTLAPSDEYTFTVVVDVTGTGDGSTLNRGTFVSTELPAGFSTIALTDLGQRALLHLDLTPSPSAAMPGATVSFTGTIRNDGNGDTAIDGQSAYVVTLPPGFSIVPGTSRIDGSPVPDPTGPGPRYTYTSGLVAPAAGASVTLTFDAAIDPTVSTGIYTSCLETWLRDVGFGKDINDARCTLGAIAVGAQRSDPPVVQAPIVTGDTCVSGTTTEADGTLIEVLVNGIIRGTATAAGGTWTVCGLPALYGGQHVTATATAPGELQSPESAPVIVDGRYACNDGADNDGDGIADFPGDPGCADPVDDDETDVPPECSDGIDNDGDGATDFPDDPSCSNADDTTESGLPECSDGIDNDGDGAADFPADTGCSDANDANEIDFAACQNGVDDDGDGFVDFPDDPGCHSAFDDDEVDLSFTPGDIRARMLLVFDTSGSMNWNTCGQNTFTGGDGSLECPGADVACSECSASGCGDGMANDSRLAKVKAGITNVISGFGEVDYALMRFHQRATAFACPRSNASLGAGGWQGGGAAPCGGGFAAGDLLVSFADDNKNTILRWIDGQSNYAGTPPPGMDWELRGTGTTPIAGTLESALAYLSSVQAADPVVSCRPYRVILVTDGEETCGGDPEAAAAALLAAGIPVHVIGFATTDPSIVANLDAIATAGGTGAAIVVSDDAALSAAMADIITDTVLVEQCNGLDDDCDGEIDEDFPDLGATCDNGELGVCRTTGTRVCRADGAGTTCNASPGTPTCPDTDPECDCNGIDDDCDGLIDEGFPATCTCVPLPEICNGLDDDCDGATDENDPADPMPGVGDPCGIDIGACEFGTLTCDGGALVCTGGVDPAVEVCDGIDNDCDTLTDELVEPCYEFASGCDLATGVCAGLCRIGLRGCLAAGEPGYPGSGQCIGDVGPAPELCNGLDDDCDGVIDNGFNVGDACDNGQTGACLVMGTFECTADGTGTFCTAFPVAPGDEVCNGIDDDCDGEIDENSPGDPLPPPIGTPCGGGPGCTAGTFECVDGSPVCVGSGGGSPEVCNGLDDDCDGLIDEDVPGEGDPCTDPGFESIGDTGECEFGITQCIDGEIVCVDYEGPTPEVCNGLDDDCDGDADDMATCPLPDEICYEGTCVVPCEMGEFPCPFGFVCRDLPDGRFCVPDPCRDVTCAAGEYCDSDTGECVDPCADVTCRPGEVCSFGNCFDCYDPGFGCDAGELCRPNADGVGECQPNPCAGVTCPTGEFCRDGDCLPLGCTTSCPDGQRCVDGDCEPDPCAGVSCPGGQSCRPTDGECVGDLCSGVVCAPQFACDPATGECTFDLCAVTECPEGYRCIIDADGLSRCQPPPGEDILAAGGGCGCAASGDAPGGQALLWLAVACALARRRRR